MKKNSKIKAYITWLILITLIIGWFLLRSQDYSAFAEKIDKLVNRQLKKFNITYLSLLKETTLEKSHLKTKWLLVNKEYTVPNDFPLKKFSGELQTAIKQEGFRIIKKEKIYEDKKEIATFTINFKNLDVYCLKLFRRPVEIKKLFITRPARPAKVAIVIDDWGYNLNNVELLSSINQKLTLAVLPDLAYSTKIAKLAGSLKTTRQVIVHLPLEPHDTTLRLEENTIMTGMDKKHIQDILNKALLNVPGALGFSNHRGSKATEDAELMRTVLSEIKKKNMFFLDSLATNKSVAHQVSRELDVRFTRRSIFLDNINEPEYIKRQLSKLANSALRTGEAVGIGHDRQATLNVLKELLPQLQREGIEIVFVSELVK